MANYLRLGKTIYHPSNVIQNTTYSPDIAKAVLTLWKNNKTGVFHVAGKLPESRYKFCKTLASTFGFDESLVKEGSVDNFLNIFGSPLYSPEPEIVYKLPLNVTLDTSKIEHSIGFSLRDYKKGLKDLAKLLCF